MMADGRAEILRAGVKADWERTADLMTLVANVNRDPKKRPYKPADFNRFADKPKQKRTPTKAEIDAEREMVIASMRLKRVTVPASEMRRTPEEPSP